MCVGCGPSHISWVATSLHEKEHECCVELGGRFDPAYPVDNVLSVEPSSQHHIQQASTFSHAVPCSMRDVPHQFPPPIPFCSTLSIKQGGRFVLKEMSASHPPQYCSFLRAERRHGRLLLHLIETHEQLQHTCGEDDDIEDGNLPARSVCSQHIKGEQKNDIYHTSDSESVEALSDCTNGQKENESNDRVQYGGAYTDACSVGEHAVCNHVAGRQCQLSQDHALLEKMQLHVNVESESASEDDTPVFRNMDNNNSFMKQAMDVSTDIRIENGACRPCEGTPLVWSSFEVSKEDGQSRPCSSNKVLLRQSFAKASTSISLATVS